MTDSTAIAPRSADQGVAAMTRLTDRLAAMAPPRPVPQPAQPRFSPAVTQALATSAALSARAAARARRSRSLTGLIVDGFVSACALLPYAAVALALRLVMAREFFLDGQSRIDGPRLPLSLPDLLRSFNVRAFDLRGFDFSVILPAQVKGETVTAFLTQIPPLPVPPAAAAYAVSYAEFILPIMLVLGFGTRFAALGLLAVTAFFQLYVMPQALWSVHVYWASLLLVLVSLGGGAISFDHLIRLFTRR